MKIKEIKEKAKKMGLKTSKKNKTQLIHEIQKSEGNFDCFGKSEHYCDQETCLWRSDCLK